MKTILQEPFDSFVRNTLTTLCLLFFGVFAPFPALLLVHAVGYSEIIEEMVKAFVIGTVVTKYDSARKKLCGAGIFGVIFGFSEAVMYLYSDIASGQLENFWLRLLITVPMHALTSIVIVLPVVLLKRNYLIVFGLALALLLHLIYNNYLATILL